jgi:glucose-6-phosphate isomerase
VHFAVEMLVGIADGGRSMSNEIFYDTSGIFAANCGLSPADFSELRPRLEASRQSVLDLVAKRKAAGAEYSGEPLDTGFFDIADRLLAERAADGDASELGQLLACAERFAGEVDSFVTVGIGGSYLGTRALFDALCLPYHNEHSSEARSGRPRIYFDGNNVDNDYVEDLSRLLTGRDVDETGSKWGIVVVSKSGGTLETAAVFRRLLGALRDSTKADPSRLPSLVLPVTGPSGNLRDLAADLGCQDIFPIPNDLGGRYSVFSAVGLLPAAILGIDIVRLLEGAAAMTERFLHAAPGDNPVLDYVAASHLLETKCGMDCRVLSSWGMQLEAIGFWYDQLLSESLGKNEQGALPLTVVATRDLHSRGQQHQAGKRDKVVTNLIANSNQLPARPLGPGEGNHDGLDEIADLTFPRILEAARQGTNRAYQMDGRPTADIVLPQLDAYAIGQLLQMLMLATVVEGDLIGINPFGQPGVEDYKREMGKILFPNR